MNFAGVMGMQGSATNIADKKLEECPYYDRGMCKLGIFQCGFGHYHKRVCLNYTIGFCPKGPECEFEHVKGIIADQDLALMVLANFPEHENFTDKSAVAALTG
jgi:hypothetical protein